MVAIQMLTYNHESFIAQAIESVMMQVTNFDYKLIICEDFSTDKTRSICVEYKNRYPDKIDLVLNEKNIGVKQNAKQVHYLCRKSGAKYICILEGDDKWIDPLKLQKQVNILEKNNDYVGVSALATIYNIDLQSITTNNYGFKQNNTWLYTDILKQGNNIPTCTFIYRNEAMPLLMPHYFYDIPYGDMGIHYLLLSNNNKYYCINEIMSQYNVHASGEYSKSSAMQRDVNELKSFLIPIRSSTFKKLSYLIKYSYIRSLALRVYINQLFKN